jgi:uncharacterized protein (DUF2236 family)
VIRRVDGDPAVLLGGGRALLMQLAHPLVARGVGDHSDFRRDPFARLQQTLALTTTIVFGTEADARAAAARIAAVHERVTGPGYRANDPDLLLWVHATLVDTALRVYERFVRPLPPGDRAAYYEESVVVGEVVGIPRSRQPPDLAAFHAYVREMISTLRVTDQARSLAWAVLHPRLPWPLEPALELGRQLTVGLLPSPLRQQYGFRWGPVRRATLGGTALASRAVLPLVPPSLRRVPRVAWA